MLPPPPTSLRATPTPLNPCSGSIIHAFAPSVPLQFLQTMMCLPDDHLPRFVASFKPVFVGDTGACLATAVVDCVASRKALARRVAGT
jgi:hypothetical protein